ncbi:MAG: ATP-dependent DNA helicase RecG [Vampirovibrionales bacterium]
MALQEEAQLKLKEMAQAIALERKHQLIDVRGRQQHFSTYIQQSLRELTRYVLDADDRLTQLRLRFQRYSIMDMASRYAAIEALETTLQGLIPSKEQQALATLQRQLLNKKQGSNLPLHQLEVSTIKGVGPRLVGLLAGLNIHTVKQLLYHAPRHYLDYKNHQAFNQLLEGQYVSVIGWVQRVQLHELPNRNLTVLRLIVSDKSGKLSAQWFFGKKQSGIMHQFKNRLPVGTEVLISGKVKWDEFNRCPQLDKADIQPLSYEDEASTTAGGLPYPTSPLVPIYPLKEGLHLKTVRKCLWQALTEFEAKLIDALPDPFRRAQHLLPLKEAFHALHFPQTLAEAEAGRRRLAFDELFFMQLRLGLLRKQYKQQSQGLCLQRQHHGFLEQFLATLPFQLTNAQHRAFQEIVADMASPEPMNRLLHGDVGSGKTIVAALTLLMGLDNGYQGALMAPTEILAEQHYRKFVEWLTPFGLKVSLLVGKLGAKARREAYASLANGQTHIAIGTHALIQEGIEFHNLGVVVVDEQHRFGVKQRMGLRQKGIQPELLSMTATPIPRTLALTVHGDLDVSVLDELPPGRSPIVTKLMGNSERREAYRLIEEQLLHGRQAYIVFPLVDESETLAARAATTEMERLQAEVFPYRRLGLLHGKLKPDEKESVMSQFAKGELDILVATTVVEVGVDVPNSTVMVIENAERFGLAQLHQLRGRVGRGSHQSYCFLIIGKRSEEVMQRLRVMEETTNGFIIAEHDLQLRGPGDYLGTRQSGLPELCLADILNDQELLVQARHTALAVINEPQWLEHYPALNEALQQANTEALGLINAG